MKKILCLLLCFIACFCCFCGCANGPIYERIGLEEAVEQGLITTEQVKSIAYYWNNANTENPPEPDFDLIPKKKLSRRTVRNIKRSYLHHSGVMDDFPNARVRDVKTYKYYGTYNGYAVVYVKDSLRKYYPLIYAEKLIGDTTFYRYTPLSVYKISE